MAAGTRSKKNLSEVLDNPNNKPPVPDMPLFCFEKQKPADNLNDRYLGQLFHVYEDQVKTLKSELSKKDDIIFDLIQIINSRENKNSSYRDFCYRESSTDFAPEQQIQTLHGCYGMNHNNSAVIRSTEDQQSAIRSTEHQSQSTMPTASETSNSLLQNTSVIDKTAQPWQLPKKAFPLSSMGSQIETSITTANRYLPLQENEWLNQDVSPIDAPPIIDTPTIDTPPIDQPPHTMQSSKKRSKRTTTIVGDSMINPIKQLNLQQSTPSSKVYIKSFPGATCEDMVDYVKPSLKHSPDLIVIHAGTNDLRSSTPEEVTERLINLATSMKTSENQIVISSLINRADHLNAKVTQVNYMLAYKCQVFKIGYLDNSNICLQHLQGGGRWGGLHLNEDGAHILKQNFINIINT